MKWYVRQACWIGAGVYAAVLVAVLAQEPIEGLRVPLEYYPDGTLRTELSARRATVGTDATIAASGIVFRVFSTNGTEDVAIMAEDAECSRERQSGWSSNAVSMRQGGMLVTGKGFEWDGTNGTLRILQQARVSFPSGMIKTEGVLKNDQKKH